VLYFKEAGFIKISLVIFVRTVKIELLVLFKDACFLSLKAHGDFIT
jgi:hypothetical protein